MKIFRFIKDGKGSVAVEFAMIASIFIASMLGVVETGRAFWTYNTLQYAMEATARYYLTHRGATDADLSAYAAGQMGADIKTAPLRVTVTKSTVSGIRQIEVDGDYTYSTIVPSMPASWSNVVLHAQAKLASP